MGPPSSGILSEIFLQYIEENYTAQMIRNYQLLDNFRYVDDIMIIYDRNVIYIYDIEQIKYFIWKGEHLDKTKLKLNSVALVRTRTIPTERPPPVGEVSANFCG